MAYSKYPDIIGGLLLDTFIMTASWGQMQNDTIYM